MTLTIVYSERLYLSLVRPVNSSESKGLRWSKWPILYVMLQLFGAGNLRPSIIRENQSHRFRSPAHEADLEILPDGDGATTVKSCETRWGRADVALPIYILSLSYSITYRYLLPSTPFDTSRNHSAFTLYSAFL